MLLFITKITTMLLFVYGTLMTGLCNHDYINNSTFIGKGITKNKYSLHVSGIIPFLHDDEEKYQVEGELYDVNSEELKDIDFIESNGEWYQRKHTVVIVNDIEYQCQTYFNNDKGIPLQHGIFRKYVDEVTRKFYNC